MIGLWLVPIQILNSEYKLDMDVIAAFIEECTEMGPGETRATDIYQVYKDWARDNEQYVMSNTKFGTVSPPVSCLTNPSLSRTPSLGSTVVTKRALFKRAISLLAVLDVFLTIMDSGCRLSIHPAVF